MSEQKPHAPGIAGKWASDLTAMQQERKPLSRATIEKVYDQKPVQKPEAKPAPARASASSSLDEALDALEKTVAPVEKRTPGEKRVDGFSLIHPAFIEPWELHDRPESEMGDLDELTESIRSFGQEIAGLVRPHPDPAKSNMYQLIYGRRRWTVCRDLGIQFKCRIEQMDDQTAAVKMVLENGGRTDLSNWAKCQSYMKMLEARLFPNQAALAAKLGIDRATLSNIMIYSRIPKRVAEAIGPMSKVSQKTAKAILSLTNDDIASEDALISLAERIREGVLTDKTLTKAVATASAKQPEAKNYLVGKKTSRKIGSYRSTDRGSSQITFNKEFVESFGGLDKIVGLLCEVLDK